MMEQLDRSSQGDREELERSIEEREGGAGVEGSPTELGQEERRMRGRESVEERSIPTASDEEDEEDEEEDEE